jgi:hypothetical protein
MVPPDVILQPAQIVVNRLGWRQQLET